MAIHLSSPTSTALTALRTPATPVSVLLVSPNDSDWIRLSQIFENTNWNLYRAKGFREAARKLQKDPVAVLVTEAKLPEGHSWQDFLEFGQTTCGVRIIVAASFKDDPLWAQVINLGGYDVLMKPFDRVEVVRVISLAWLNWRDAMRNSSERKRPTTH